MSISEAVKRIRVGKEYNLSHIRDQGLLPWTQNLQTIRKVVKKDFWGENMLKAQISGTGGGVEYRIKGREIKKFIKRYGHGMMMARAHKINGKHTASRASSRKQS